MDDGQADAVAVSCARRLALALVKRLEDAGGVVRRHARPLVVTVEQQLAVALAKTEIHQAAMRTEAYRIGQQVADGNRHFISVHRDGPRQPLAVHRQARRLPLQALAVDHAGHQHRHVGWCAVQVVGVETGFVVAQQRFDLVLQRCRVLVEDAGDLALVGGELARHAVFQQGHAFAQRRQRRFQFVRDMAHEARLVFFQLGQVLAQPVQLLAHALQVGGAAHGDWFVEPVFAQQVDTGLDLRQRARQPQAEAAGQQGGQHDGRDHLRTEHRAPLVELVEQGGIAAIHFLFYFCSKIVIDFRQRRQRPLQVLLAGGAARPGRGLQQVPRLFARFAPALKLLGGCARQALLQGIERRACFTPGIGIAFAEGGVVQNKELARAARHGNAALGKLLSVAGKGQRVVSAVAAVGGQAVERPQRMQGRCAEQHSDQQENAQQQLAKRQFREHGGRLWNGQPRIIGRNRSVCLFD